MGKNFRAQELIKMFMIGILIVGSCATKVPRISRPSPSQARLRRHKPAILSPNEFPGTPVTPGLSMTPLVSLNDPELDGSGRLPVLERVHSPIPKQEYRRNRMKSPQGRNQMFVLDPREEEKREEVIFLEPKNLMAEKMKILRKKEQELRNFHNKLSKDLDQKVRVFEAERREREAEKAERLQTPKHKTERAHRRRKSYDARPWEDQLPRYQRRRTAKRDTRARRSSPRSRPANRKRHRRRVTWEDEVPNRRSRSPEARSPIPPMELISHIGFDEDSSLETTDTESG